MTEQVRAVLLPLRIVKQLAVLAVVLTACGTTVAAPAASTQVVPTAQVVYVTSSPQVIYVTPAPGSTAVPTVAVPSSTAMLTQPPPTAVPTNAGQTLEPTPTDAPPTDAPVPTALSGASSVVITQQYFKAYGDGYGSLYYEAIVEVQNVGGAPAGIDGGSNDYTVYYKDGSVAATGDFTYAFPQIVMPGAFGYYVDSGSFDDGAKLSAIGKFDPSVEYADTTCDPGMLVVSKVRVTQESYSTGLSASGVVTNNGSADASDVIVGFIFFDSTGNLNGALYDNTAGALSAGKSKGSSTSYPGTPPLKPSAVQSYKAIAYDQQYFC